MTDMTMDDLKNSHIAVAHDVAAVGEKVAKASPGFDESADYQQDAIIAWYTVKVLLASIERSGLLTSQQIDTSDIRDQAKMLANELTQGVSNA